MAKQGFFLTQIYCYIPFRWTSDKWNLPIANLVLCFSKTVAVPIEIRIETCFLPLGYLHALYHHNLKQRINGDLMHRETTLISELYNGICPIQIGLAKEYPTMHYFGFSRPTQSTIAY